MNVRHDPDVVMAKAASVRKCVAAIAAVKAADPPLVPWMAQDLVVLNLQRAIQACLDLANHLIASNDWELPRSASHSVNIVIDQGVVPAELRSSLIAMVGFRNIAVHEYAALDAAILAAIVEKHLPDLEAYASACMRLLDLP